MRNRLPLVTAALSTSLDGFVAGVDDSPTQPLGTGGERLFRWFGDGETPSRYYRSMRMSAASAEVLDALAGRIGANVAGRRTYDVSDAWGGSGPQPGVPLFVVTHTVPDSVPKGDPPYTFVTEGIESAVARARIAAGPKNVDLMGASIVQQALREGLLDELTIHLVPVVIGRGVRLLDGLDSGSVEFELLRVVDAPGVTHMTYRVVK